MKSALTIAPAAENTPAGGIPEAVPQLIKATATTLPEQVDALARARAAVPA